MSLNYLILLICLIFKSVYFINYSSFLIYQIKIKKSYFIMSDNLLEIDSAMNMIKEEIIRELYESVSKQNNDSYLKGISSNNITFSEKHLD